MNGRAGFVNTMWIKTTQFPFDRKISHFYQYPEGLDFITVAYLSYLFVYTLLNLIYGDEFIRLSTLF